MMIDGHKIEGDSAGLHYIQGLNAAEADVLFDRARSKGRAEFDCNNKHYALVRTHAGTYVVTDLKTSSGFF